MDACRLIRASSADIFHSQDPTVLTYLAQRTGTVPASTIARDLDLPRSSVYHILTVLTERGFTVYVPEARGYALGASAYRLASAFTMHDQLERMARPVLRSVSAAGRFFLMVVW